MNMLPYEQLEKLNTKRLLALYKSVRAKASHNRNTLLCDCCGEFLGSWEEWEEEKAKLKPYEDYKDRIKQLLDEREHIKR